MAVYKQKASKNWWYKFTWKGEQIRESTRQTNRRVAEQMEAARKTQLAKGEVGIRDRSPVPTIARFADERFLPFVRSAKAEKTRTVVFYETCVSNLKSDKKLAGLPLNAITQEHLTGFIESRRSEGMKTSTINRDLATLRRILRLAEEWGVIEAARRVKLLDGEARRERVVTHEEEHRYLSTAPRLMRTLALMMLDCGLRPEECHRLRWEDNIRDGAIEIHRGKREGSRRTVEMSARLREELETLRADAKQGWVFPAPTKIGHIDVSSYKKQHATALKESNVSGFVVYSLRHTCLTRWAKEGMDPYSLKYLAGHKSLATTMLYIHLAQTDAQDRLREVRQLMNDRKDRHGHNSRHSASSGHSPQADELTPTH
ncbi:MAG: tyrosine-type recombinase/integrase [Bryobacteraceae bacterium]